MTFRSLPSEPLTDHEVRVLEGANADWKEFKLGQRVRLFRRALDAVKYFTWMPTESQARNGFSNPAQLPASVVELFHLHCPQDLGQLVSVTMRLEKLSGGLGAQNIDLVLHLGGNGEDKAIRTAADATTTYDIPVLMQFADFDITALFDSMLAGDNIGLALTNKESNSIYVYSITIAYLTATVSP